MRCLLCGKTVPLFRMLQERKFCSDAHQEQHHRLLLACLTGGERDSAPQRERGPEAAGFVAELVGLANAVAEPLPGMAVPFRCAAAFEPTACGMCDPVGPPAAALIPIRTMQLDYRADPAPAAKIPRTSQALPLLDVQAGANGLRHGLLLASVALLEPRAVETQADPATAGSARPFAPVEPLFESAAGHRRQVIEAPQSLQDSPPKAGFIVLVPDSLSGPAIPVRCAPRVIVTAQLLPRLRLAHRGKAWDGAAALPVGLREASEILPVPLPFNVSGAACAFPTQDLRLPVNQAIPQAAGSPIRRGLRVYGPSCAHGAAAEAPVAALAMHAWALPNTQSLGPLSPAPVPLKLAPPGLAKLQAAAVPTQCSRAGSSSYTLGEAEGPPVAALAMHVWALPNASSLGSFSLAPVPLKLAPPGLAKLQAAALSVQLSPGEPQFTPDNRWRVRLIIRRPRRESWKSPIPPEAATEDHQAMRPIPTPKPTLLVKLANWKPVTAPARAAILALLLIGAAFVLWTPVKPAVRQARETVRAYLLDRSEVLIEDDFLSGISGWDGGPGWANEWAYGAAGFVQPRKLALLTASLPLADYRVEFLGQIDKKSLSWVFRATDLNNYYAMKLVIARPGPLPLCAIVRYTVVDGAAVDRVQLPLSLSIRNDTLYRVETSVQQDRFTTTINGQVVDTFYDRRHPSGGVGLFSGPGESSRILWIRVAEQDDLLGRLCAYFSRDSVDRKAGFLPIAKKRKAVTE